MSRMNGQKHVAFEIDAEGNIKLEGMNFGGAECDQHMRLLASVLGDTQSTKHKPEYNVNRGGNVQTTGR